MEYELMLQESIFILRDADSTAVHISSSIRNIIKCVILILNEGKPIQCVETFSTAFRTAIECLLISNSDLQLDAVLKESSECHEILLTSIKDSYEVSRSQNIAVLQEAVLLFFLLNTRSHDNKDNDVEDFHIWFNVLSPLLLSDDWELNAGVLEVLRSANCINFRSGSHSKQQNVKSVQHILEERCVKKVIEMLSEGSDNWKNFNNIIFQIFKNETLNVNPCDFDETLSVLKLCFKSNVFELRLIAYLCMKQIIHLLINTYSTKTDILCYVIMSPFCDNLPNTYPYANVILETWWDILCVINPSKHSNINTVITCFLEFTFGPRQHPQSGGSCILDGNSSLCLYAGVTLCEILNHPSLKTYETNILPHLRANVISDVLSFNDLSHVLIHSVTKCTIHVSNLKEIKLIKHIWTCLLTWFKDLYELQQDVSIVLMRRLVDAVTHVVKAVDKYPHVYDIILDPILLLFTQILPEKLLITPFVTQQLDDFKFTTPTVCFLDIIFDSSLFPVLSSSISYLNIFQYLITLEIKNNNSTSCVVTFTLEKLKVLYVTLHSSIYRLQVIFMNIWKCIAQQILNYIMNKETVKTNILQIVRSVLMFPLEIDFHINKLQIHQLLLVMWEHLFDASFKLIKTENSAIIKEFYEYFIDKLHDKYSIPNMTVSQQLYVAYALNVLVKKMLPIIYVQKESQKFSYTLGYTKAFEEDRENLFCLFSALMKSVLVNTLPELYSYIVQPLMESLITICSFVNMNCHLSYSTFTFFMDIISFLGNAPFDFNNLEFQERIVTLYTDFKITSMVMLFCYPLVEVRESFVSAMYHTQNILRSNNVMFHSNELFQNLRNLVKYLCTSAMEYNSEEQCLVECEEENYKNYLVMSSLVGPKRALPKLSHTSSFKMDSSGLTRYNKCMLPIRKRLIGSDDTGTGTMKRKLKNVDDMIQDKKVPKKRGRKKKVITDAQSLPSTEVSCDSVSRNEQSTVPVKSNSSLPESERHVSPAPENSSALSVSNQVVVNPVTSGTSHASDNGVGSSSTQHPTEVLSIPGQDIREQSSAHSTDISLKIDSNLSCKNDNILNNINNEEKIICGEHTLTNSTNVICDGTLSDRRGEDVTREVESSCNKHEFKLPIEACFVDNSFKEILLFLLKLAEITCSHSDNKNQNKNPTEKGCLVVESTVQSLQCFSYGENCPHELENCDETQASNSNKECFCHQKISFCEWNLSDQNEYSQYDTDKIIPPVDNRQINLTDENSTSSNYSNHTMMNTHFRKIHLHKYGLFTYLVENSNALQSLLYGPNKALQKACVKLTEFLEYWLNSVEHANCPCGEMTEILTGSKLLYLRPLGRNLKDKSPEMASIDKRTSSGAETCDSLQYLDLEFNEQHYSTTDVLCANDVDVAPDLTDCDNNINDISNLLVSDEKNMSEIPTLESENIRNLSEINIQEEISEFVTIDNLISYKQFKEENLIASEKYQSEYLRPCESKEEKILPSEEFKNGDFLLREGSENNLSQNLENIQKSAFETCNEELISPSESSNHATKISYKFSSPSQNSNKEVNIADVSSKSPNVGAGKKMMNKQNAHLYRCEIKDLKVIIKKWDNEPIPIENSGQLIPPVSAQKHLEPDASVKQSPVNESTSTTLSQRRRLCQIRKYRRKKYWT